MITEQQGGTIFHLGSGDYFGGKAVVAEGDYVSRQTCIVEEENTVCWRLTRTDIKAVIGDLKLLGKPIPFTPKAFDSTLGIQDVKRHKMLGMGTLQFLRSTLPHTRSFCLFLLRIDRLYCICIYD